MNFLTSLYLRDLELTKATTWSWRTTLIFLLISSLHANATDYMKMRESLLLGTNCGWPDSLMIERVRTNLLSVDSSGISKNIHQYYYDLGMIHYKASKGNPLSAEWQLALQAFESSVHHKLTSHALWQCAFCAIFSKQCAKGEAYLQRYEQSEKRRRLTQKAGKLKELRSECN